MFNHILSLGWAPQRQYMAEKQVLRGSVQNISFKGREKELLEVGEKPENFGVTKTKGMRELQGEKERSTVKRANNPDLLWVSDSHIQLPIWYPLGCQADISNLPRCLQNRALDSPHSLPHTHLTVFLSVFPSLKIDNTTPSLLTFNPVTGSTQSTSTVYVEYVYFGSYLLRSPFQSILVFCLNYSIQAGLFPPSIVPPAVHAPPSGQVIF